MVVAGDGEPTLGTADWKRMLVAGAGAEDSMEMMTTRTSGRDGGQSRAKWKSTLRLCLSNTVTGNRLPRGGRESTRHSRCFNSVSYVYV